MGNTLYLSGQIGIVPGTMTLVSGGIKEEAKQTMENIKTSLEAHGYSNKELTKYVYICFNRLDYRNKVTVSQSKLNCFLGCYICLISLTTNSNIIAPAVAVIIEPIKPPAEMPSKLNT